MFSRHFCAVTRHKWSLVSTVLTVLLLTACGSGGGGGGGGSVGSGAVASQMTFPVNTAMANLVTNGFDAPFQISGTIGSYSLTGSGTYSWAPAAATYFGGKPALDASIVGNVSETANGVNASGTFAIHQYFSPDNYYPLGQIDTSDGTYYLVTSFSGWPTAAKVGDSGKLGAVTIYLDRTKTTITGYEQLSYTLEADTADTAIFVLKTADSDQNNVPTTASEDSYRITSNGDVTYISTHGVDSPGTQDAVNLWIKATSVQSPGKAAPLSPPVIMNTVISTNPANGASAISTNSAITATFSEPVDPATITAASFTLLMNGTVPVSGTVTLANSTTAIFTPSAYLAPNTYFTATITAGVKDLFGNAMTTNYSWSFWTSALPAVISTSPLPYVYPVALDSAITATFSKAMDPASVTSTSFTLIGGTTPVAGSVTYSGNTATFTPSVLFSSNTIYRATITSGVKDLTGTSMGADYSWTFQTFAPGTATTPIPFNPPPAGLWQAVTDSTPATGNFVYLQSDVGDYIGQGQTYIYTPLNATLTVSATGDHLSVGISGNNWWTGDFQTPNAISQLQPGYYPGLMRYPFNNPVLGGLTWYGDGRGCNTLQGWFAVDHVTYVSGALTAIDLRFEQLCEGGTKALHGAIHWEQ